MWQTEIEWQHVGVEGRRFSATDLHELAALSVEEEDGALRAVYAFLAEWFSPASTGGSADFRFHRCPQADESGKSADDA